MQWPMDVDFVKYLSGKSSKLLKVKHHDIPSMKRTFNKGGRPVLEAAQRQKYIVSARLDSEHYFRLKKLARISGCRPSEIIRQLIGRE